MCKETGIHRKTNHSLYATGASAMLNANVLEKLIRVVAGNQSSALNLYEQPTGKGSLYLVFSSKKKSHSRIKKIVVNSILLQE